MRFFGESLILEGGEVKAFNILSQYLMKDIGLKTAFKKTWEACPSLDRVSRNTVVSASLRMLSAYTVIVALKPEMHPMNVFEEAIERANIIRSPDVDISHEPDDRKIVVSTGIPDGIIPSGDSTPRKVQISGVAHPTGKMRELFAFNQALD